MKKSIIKGIIIVVIAILLEVIVFNYKFYITRGYNKIDYTNDIVTTNMEKIEENNYKITDKEPYIEIDNINTKINNIYIDVENDTNNTYYLYTYLTDSANELFYQVPDREIHEKIDKSKYLAVKTSGDSEKIKFSATFDIDEIITINEISINKPCKMKIEIVRILAVILIEILIIMFNPKSKLYNILYKDFKHKKLLFLGVSLVIVLFYSALAYKGFIFFKTEGDHAPIYNRLAHSLLEGKTYFEDPNNSEEVLNNMSNPYDYELRMKTFEDLENKEFWDNAFYEGKYYCYFGVVPVVLFYIPYFLIFHSEIHVTLLIAFLCMGSSILLVSLLHQVIKNYFKKASLGLFLLLDMVLVLCTGLLYFTRFIAIYSIPILSGLFFNFLGINLLFSILNCKKLVHLRIFAGAFSLALVAGCRPQLIMGSAFVLPIMYEYLRINKFDIKKNISKIICIIISYVIVAIALMFYNYIRFKSPFDFGANYNLTTNDMTKRGFDITRIPIGLCMLLFNPVNMENVFPYIVGTPLKTNYMGNTIYEPTYGGVFFSVLITSFNLLIFRFKKYFEKKQIWFWTCIISIIASILIIIIDVNGAGILARYVCDFSWLLVLSAIIIILVLNENKNVNKKVLLEIVIALAFASIAYQFFYYFVSILNQYKDANIRLWLYVYYLFQFWI